MAERRLVPRWFQPLRLSSETPVSKFVFQIQILNLYRSIKLWDVAHLWQRDLRAEAAAGGGSEFGGRGDDDDDDSDDSDDEDAGGKKRWGCTRRLQFTRSFATAWFPTVDTYLETAWFHFNP
jgi:hypothetical protein